jgi:hypothetical protein
MIRALESDEVERVLRGSTGGKNMNSVYVVAESPIDWESPAGPVDEQAQPRVGVPDFYYFGPGDKHWIGQPCDVLGTLPGDPGARLVRLACGCRTRVPRAFLQPC